MKEQYLFSGAKFGGYGSFFPTQKHSTKKVNVNVKKVKRKSNFTKSMFAFQVEKPGGPFGPANHRFRSPMNVIT